MIILLNFFKTVFTQDAEKQRDDLAAARFEGASYAFAQLQNRIPYELLQKGASGGSVPERAAVFYALAAARMQLARQLDGALREDMAALKHASHSQIQLDLEALANQVELLTRAAVRELAHPQSTVGAWEVQQHLRESIARAESERGVDSVAHARATYQGALILLSDLRKQLDEKEQQSEDRSNFQTADALLAEAQHAFDTVQPLFRRLQADPAPFARRDSVMHEELERQVGQAVHLLEDAAAEIAVPQVTQTSFWQSMHQGSVGVPDDVAQSEPLRSTARPWEQDIWCMTSRLFTQTNAHDRKAIRLLREMWQTDPSPETTWTWYAHVRELERTHAISKTGHFYNACPWVDIWHANQNVRIGDTHIKAGKDFSLHVEGDGDEAFRRDVIVAHFSPTREIDYCEDD